ncbi:hypothetical protein BSQ44_07570 [Aquibium oceanicum]|uniref:Uncharacterized protein n=1 Tax=Aquibium oceanicum TaxID=1670800 RepID=A0A1L3SPA4_9HYPH|nr:hypothetical protein BSQ44_07570 [Aquibium oceanicum]
MGADSHECIVSVWTRKHFLKEQKPYKDGTLSPGHLGMPRRERVGLAISILFIIVSEAGFYIKKLT